jgi:hypothetical protein
MKYDDLIRNHNFGLDPVLVRLNFWKGNGLRCFLTRLLLCDELANLRHGGTGYVSDRCDDGEVGVIVTIPRTVPDLAGGSYQILSFSYISYNLFNLHGYVDIPSN